MDWPCFERLLHELTKGTMRDKPTRGEEFKRYMIWQTVVAMLYSNGQLRTKRDGDTEKGCKKKPAVQQKTTEPN